VIDSLAREGQNVTCAASEPICSSCAWLGLRVRSDKSIVEADENFRATGCVPGSAVNSAMPLFDSCPLCFAGVRSFYADLQRPDAEDHCVRAEIARPCPCPEKYHRWQPGLSPKEMQAALMLDEQRQFQAEQARLADARHDRTLWINGAIAIIAALIGAAAALVAVYVGG
jgi:hypothetical protein